jgi:hypothetical protein
MGGRQFLLSSGKQYLGSDSKHYNTRDINCTAVQWMSAATVSRTFLDRGVGIKRKEPFRTIVATIIR